MSHESKKGVNSGRSFMGFKLKKKNTGESSSRSGGNAFLAKIQSQADQLSRVFGDSEKSSHSFTEQLAVS